MVNCNAQGCLEIGNSELNQESYCTRKVATKAPADSSMITDIGQLGSVLESFRLIKQYTF